MRKLTYDELNLLVKFTMMMNVKQHKKISIQDFERLLMSNAGYLFENYPKYGEVKDVEGKR